jgi:hypothetical protein
MSLGAKNFKDSLTTIIGLTICIALPVILLQGYVFVHAEQPLYIWDSKAYWMTWEHFGRLALKMPFRWLHETIGGIEANDYNPLPVSLLFPFYYLPLSSRYAYILGLTLCYLLPVVVLVQLTMQRFAGYQSRGWVLFIALVTVCYAPFWKPTLRGLPDVVGLIPLIMVVIYGLGQDFASKLSFKKIFLTGLLLWMPFLLRRWYAYTIVSVYLTLPLLNYAQYSWASPDRLRRVLVTGLHFLFAGLISIACALIFQHILIRRILSTNYAGIYAAYQDGMAVSLSLALASPGVYILVPVALGLVWALTPSRTAEKNFVLFCLTNLLISFFLFTRTQSPGIQHCLPFSLWMLFAAIPGFRWLVNALRISMLQIFVMSLGVAASLAVFIMTFNNFGLGAVLNTKLLPDQTYPMYVDNYQNYQALADRLVELTQDASQVAVLSSDGVLSDDLMSTVSGGRLDPHLVYSSQVDLRDKIRLSTLMARYVVVADPIQLHLAADGQRVIWIPASEILSHTGIGTAYQKLPQDYVLANNVTAKLYEKTRPFTAPEITDFFARFTSVYPDWQRSYFSGFVIPYLTADITLGDLWGRFTLSDNGSVIFTHPGEHIPTSGVWYFGNLGVVTITSTNICPQADGVAVTFKTVSGLTASVNIPDGGSQKVNLTAFDHQMGSVSIDKKANSICDSTELRAD